MRWAGGGGHTVPKYKTLWQNVEQEIDILRKLDHPNIIKLYEIITDNENEKVYLVEEYADKGEILKWDDKKEVFFYTDPQL